MQINGGDGGVTPIAGKNVVSACVQFLCCHSSFDGQNLDFALIRSELFCDHRNWSASQRRQRHADQVRPVGDFIHVRCTYHAQSVP
jgi:hypothetical protein